MDMIGLKRYEERLLKRREEILTIAKHLQKEKLEVTEQRHFDWLDQARDENELRLLDRLSDGYLQELSRINRARVRILAETYGLCLACHQPINEARLNLFPETEFCRECQDMREKFEKAA